MSAEIKAKINLRKDVLANWEAKNPVLGSGEMAIVEDEGGVLAVKIGNGLSSFNQLPFLYQQEFKTEKLTAKEATFKSLSQGYNVSSTPTSLATGVFSEAKGNFGVVHGIEARILSSDDYAFVFNGENLSNVNDRYVSHGSGTFNVNPVGGLSGFYVGEKNLYSLLSSKVDGECAFTSPIKAALMACFDNVAWKDDDATEYRNLKRILGLPLVETITLSHDSVTIEAGDSFTLVASVSPNTIDSTTLEWWSGDENVATVKDGVVNAISNGNVVIYAAKDGIKAECQITVATSTVEYTVTNNLVNCSSSNSSTTVVKGTSYSATISPDAGYKLDTVVYCMGGNEYQVSNGIISIASVTDNIVITGSAVELEDYSVSFTGDNYSSSNTQTTVKENSPYTCKITASDGYKVTGITCLMGGDSQTVSDDGTISIASVTGNVEINVTTTALTTFTITNNLTNCTTSNTATSAYEGSSYGATLTPDSEYRFTMVSVTMGGVEQSVSDGQISIQQVTGDIVVTAVAEQTYVHSVTYQLSGCTSNNQETNVEDGKSYTTYLKQDSGYIITDVVATMGGELLDVGVGWEISVGSVSSDIVISANAVSGYVETLTSDYAASGNSFSFDVFPMSLSSGDYVEVQIDLSSNTTDDVNQNIITVGKNLSEWWVAGSSRYHFYYSPSTKSLELDAIPGTGSSMHWSRIMFDLNNVLSGDSSTKLNLKFGKDGIFIQDNLVNPNTVDYKTGSSGYDSSSYCDVIQDLLSCDSIQVGSTQGDTRSSFTYDFIRVVRKSSPPTFSVIKNLTDCSASNMTDNVVQGYQYSTVLTPDYKYQIKTVVVTMDGAEVSGAYDETTRTVLIPDVAGDIVITATSEMMQYDVLCADFDQSSGWKVDVSGLDFASGDILEVQMNLSAVTNFEYCDMVTIGTDVSKTWQNSGEALNFYLFSSNSSGYQIDVLKMQEFYGGSIPDTTTSQLQYCTMRFSVAKDEIVVEVVENGLVSSRHYSKLSDFESGYNKPIECLQMIKNYTEMQVGFIRSNINSQNTDRQNVHYDYVRVYHAV